MESGQSCKVHRHMLPLSVTPLRLQHNSQLALISGACVGVKNSPYWKVPVVCFQSAICCFQLTMATWACLCMRIFGSHIHWEEPSMYVWPLHFSVFLLSSHPFHFPWTGLLSSCRRALPSVPHAQSAEKPWVQQEHTNKQASETDAHRWPDDRRAANHRLSVTWL